jgi:hypothetical protein
MLILHVSAPTGQLQRGNLQWNICINNTVQDVHMLCYNKMLLINTLLKMYRPTTWIWINVRYNGFDYISKKKLVFEVFRTFLHLFLSAPECCNKYIDKQNTWEQKPFMNYCMIFQYNTHTCKHVFQQHGFMDAACSTPWFSLVWTSANCPVFVCVVCPFVQFNGRVQRNAICKS